MFTLITQCANRYSRLALIAVAMLTLSACAGRYNIAAMSAQVHKTAVAPLELVVKNQIVAMPVIDSGATASVRHAETIRSHLSTVDVEKVLANNLNNHVRQKTGVLATVDVNSPVSPFKPRYYSPDSRYLTRISSTMREPRVPTTGQPVLAVDYGFSQSFSHLGVNAQLAYKTKADQKPFVVGLVVTKTAGEVIEDTQQAHLSYWAENPDMLRQALSEVLQELAVIVVDTLNNKLPEATQQRADFAAYDGRAFLGSKVLSENNGRALLKYQTAPYRPAIVASVDIADITNPPVWITEHRAKVEADRERQYWLQQSMQRHYELQRALRYHYHPHYPSRGVLYRR